ncbi:hypothetical protein [Streptomyces sp. NPDC088733]|uniref:hypothetical protein n=1 Tax=Streptomyces sp. NPDC088733 TaxID=3365880 RepID=UPI003823B2B3
MSRKHLARYGGPHASARRDIVWSHPYGHGPFSPYLYADGGDDGGSGSGSDDGAGDGSGGDDAGSDAGTGGTGDSGGQQSDFGKGDDHTATIKRLEKDLADARKDAAKSRTAAKQQAADEAVASLTEKIGKALGLVKEDGPPDPAKLVEQITAQAGTIAERDSTIQGLNVELAVWARADKAGARAGALLDSRAFVKAIAGLDPAASGFTKALDDAIKDAVKTNPAYGTQTAGRSGGDQGGGSGEGKTKQRPTSLSAAVRGTFNT